MKTSLSLALALTLAGLSPVRIPLPPIASDYDEGVFYSNDGVVIDIKTLADIEGIKLSPVVGQLFDTIQKINFPFPASVDQEIYLVVSKNITNPRTPKDTYSLVISAEHTSEGENPPLVIPIDVWKYDDGDISVNPSYNNRTSVIIPNENTNIEEVCRQCLYVLSSLEIEVTNSPSNSYPSSEAHMAYRRSLRDRNNSARTGSNLTSNPGSGAGVTIPLSMERVHTLSSPQVHDLNVSEDVELLNPFLTRQV